ncbi:hypothetical protein [Loigolactobacillus binensis]|uniref:Uncharacterized protein n=1 Tax=Loigolactobacillus binensis TaxID=2559922 RepID=A0ABW3EG72_9LACO|nr:hypothetical protein [Loigolactobacillus binensis]
MNRVREKNRSFFISVLVCIAVLILFFQNSLQTIFAPFNYFDEFISILFLTLYFIRLVYCKVISKSDLLFLVLSIICIIIGFIGNYISNGQSSFFYIISDIVSTFRFLWLYIGLKSRYSYSFNRILMYKKIFLFLGFIFKIYVVFVFTFGVINLFSNIHMSYEIRYGLRSYAFIFGTPGLVINQMTYVLIFLTAYKEFLGKNVNTYIFMTLATIIFTLRSRGFILVVVYFGLYWATVWTTNNHIKLKSIFGGIVLVILGYSQFKYYFLADDFTPRRRFVNGAIQLIHTYIPFGSGFATFGSSSAAQHYSQTYYDMGFSILRGMGPVDQLYLNDNYFPMIFGQLGLIGAVVFIYLLYYFAKDFLKTFFINCSSTSRVISGFILSDIFLSSIQSSYLAHYSVVALIFIGMFCLNALKVNGVNKSI